MFFWWMVAHYGVDLGASHGGFQSKAAPPPATAAAAGRIGGPVRRLIGVRGRLLCGGHAGPVPEVGSGQDPP